MSDFNQRQSFTSALRLLQALDDQGLEWFLEEPIVFDDYTGCARLANQLKTPISIGENILGPREFLRAVQAGAADCYMPDLMRHWWGYRSGSAPPRSPGRQICRCPVISILNSPPISCA